MVLCDLYLKRFDLTKDVLFKTFVITVWYKLCRCDHSVLYKLSKSSWVLCPVNVVKKLFSTNLSSESSSFN